MKTLAIAFLVICGLFLVSPGPAQAHHSVAAEFDAGSLMTSLIKDKIKGLFAKLFGRG